MNIKVAIGYLFLCLFTGFSLVSQEEFHSAHQEHKQLYGKDFNENLDIASENTRSSSSATCNLDYIFYGFHPYWKNGKESNYNWDLITHFSYFDYEVNPSNGFPITTHGFETAASVTKALNEGKKVTLTATLFGNTDNATFLSNQTSRQTLITKLINLVSSRGAHGVCIDFEGIPASQSANFTLFMTALCNQMHSAIPNSEVSTVLYNVDWSNVIDVATLNNYVDHFIIMAYDYYWSGSAIAGPNANLYSFEELSYSRSVSRTITDNLKKGASKSKLICALPFYGRRWKVSNQTVPAPSTGSSGSAPVIFDDFKDNVNGYYSLQNRRTFEPNYQTYYNYTASGSMYQLFIDDAYSFRYKLKHIKNTGIAGTGAWALGYCDQYDDLWDEVEYYLTDCYETPCKDTLYDFGGPLRNYHNDENYIVTIKPNETVTNKISFSFLAMDIEDGFDYLYVYAGADTNAPQVPGSPFTGTTLPSDFYIDTNVFTYRVKNDGNTKKPGFSLEYTCSYTEPLDTTSDTTVTVGIDDLAHLEGVSLFPNPAKTEFTIQMEDFEGTNIQVLNAHGQLLDNRRASSYRTIFSLATYPKGVYFVKLTKNRAVVVKKLVVE